MIRLERSDLVSNEKKRHRLFLLYVALMVLAFVLPTPNTPLAESQHVDKVVHFGIFLGFVVLSHWDQHWSLWRTFLIAAAFAGAIELLQSQLSYRQGDWWDFLAGAAGAAAGTLVLLILAGGGIRKRM